MNRSYIDKLINRNRTGTLIKLIKVSIHNWSVNNYQYIFEECVEHKLYHIFYFMMDHFIRSNCISFYDKFTNYCYLFYWTCEDDQIDLAKYLLSEKVTNKYVNIFEDDNEVLTDACENGCSNIIKYLLSNNVTKKYPNIDPCNNYRMNNYLIRTACYYKYVDIIKYLLINEITNMYQDITISSYGKGLCELYINVDGVNISILEYLLSDEEIILKYPLLTLY
jgi:hypothetical protein